MSEKAAIDERLEKALEFSNYRTTLNRQKKNAKMRFDNALSFSIHGGTFKVTPDLISFISTLCAAGKMQVPLLDIYDTAILVTDLPAFLQQITDIYYMSMNDYLAECNNIKTARSVKALLDM